MTFPTAKDECIVKQPGHRTRRWDDGVARAFGCGSPSSVLCVFVVHLHSGRSLREFAWCLGASCTVHETGTGVFRMIGALFISSALMPKHDAAHVSDQGHHSLVERNKKTPTIYNYIGLKRGAALLSQHSSAM